MERAEHLRRVNKVIAKAWLDPDFKARLLADPHTVLKEEGCKPQPTVHIHQDTDDVCHLVLPRRPSSLSDDDLRADEPHPDLCSTVCVLCT